MTETTGLLVMAYGTASGPDDIERYYTDIRGGRPPSPEHLEELIDRYAAIGNVFPLTDITTAEADGLAATLKGRGMGPLRPYLGMKHSPPFISEAVAAMRADGIEHAVGIVMAPHWSGMSIQTYTDRVTTSVIESGGPSFSFVEQWYDHRSFLAFLTSRVADAHAKLAEDERANPYTIFSAHSLPTRTLDDGSMRCKYCTADRCADRCTYGAQMRDTADRIAGSLGLAAYGTAWQSAGRTADRWWGPPIEDVIPELAEKGHTAVVVCSAGFVTDHLEILYDLDIETAEIARDAGIAFTRTEMPNADPVFIEALGDVVADHLDGSR
ncbi:MAG: ferrochelatase [Actinomycetota bacterium]